jgi:hypothetical protein
MLKFFGSFISQVKHPLAGEDVHTINFVMGKWHSGSAPASHSLISIGIDCMRSWVQSPTCPSPKMYALLIILLLRCF